VKQRLEIVSKSKQRADIEVVKEQEGNQLLVYAEQLAQLELGFSERPSIAEQLRVLFARG